MKNNFNESINKPTKESENEYHKKLITNLNTRGWALYKSGITIYDENDLKNIVLKGSEKESLVHSVRYQILPYIEEDSNYEKVKKAMYACLTTNRYPFWVDLETYINIDEDGKEKEHVKSNGVYLIDTIVYEELHYELVVDYLLMDNLNVITENKGNIILDINDIDKILKQMTLRERKCQSVQKAE